MVGGRARRQGTTAVALAAVALVAGAQLSSLVHHATVAHVFCPEHGRLEHLERGETAGGVRSTDHAVRAAAADAARAHEQCSVAALGRMPLLPGGSLGVAPAAPKDEPRIQPGDAPGSRRLRLLLAPKSSPPASHALA